ncbi:hypothetical protein [Youngiibacter multivorans]|uniref:PD-(D/E)XK nuclease superfamily protein n=1 Tax=Youngiibacter multivorans TaxID=937251 RepID=A0ABS4G7Y6_9CLOT|nr:hypothetical protein [Youngiibacter multivorans]MBP1920670.1 hypothetical protein [Youngiibacter multivorans]
MITSDGHDLEVVESGNKIEIRISFAGEKCEGYDSHASSKDGTEPDVRQEKLNQLVLELIRDLLLSGRVSDKSGISIFVSDVNSREALGLVRYLEDRSIDVHAPGSVVFFEREEVMLLIGCMIRLFPDYDLEICDCDESIISYYWTCIDFAEEAMRGVFGVPLKKFVEKVSKAHHRLYMATEYSFSGLFYRLLEFDPFSSWLKKGDCREVRDMAVFSRTLCDFEENRGILVLEPESYVRHVKELFDVLIPDLFRKGTKGYETGSAGIMKDSIGLYGIDRLNAIGEKPATSGSEAILSIFGDIDMYGSCQKKYWLLSVMGFRPSRSVSHLRDELVIRTIRKINEIAEDLGSFPASRDSVSDLLSSVMKDMDICGSYVEKAEAYALRQVMKYLKGQEINFTVLENDSTERLESEGFAASGSFTLIENPMGELEALSVFPGKLPGAGEVNRKAGLLQVMASLHGERTGEWISRRILFFSGEDKKDPFIVFDSDEGLELNGLKDIGDASCGIREGRFAALSSDREVCLACDFRFHCKRTDMRKPKKG